MRAKLLLADAAKVSDGKVDALGLAWSTTTTPTPPAAIILLLQFGWDETDQSRAVVVELLDADGKPVLVNGPNGTAPLRIEGNVEAGRPPDVPAGTPIDVPLAFGIGPGMNLRAGQRYEWRLSLDGETHEDWEVSFLIRP
ncbi:hypothetical protein [Cellulomonas sp. URHD0024]|uniref:DUF6941 family protein n=1 Tax=Cellulomonas sp. URHD0024 TaxID=1302620 RepID=UPI0004238D52|nr:hypothetical protein [Cellulomonas sp. URHD0024]